MRNLRKAQEFHNFVNDSMHSLERSHRKKDLYYAGKVLKELKGVIESATNIKNAVQILSVADNVTGAAAMMASSPEILGGKTTAFAIGKLCGSKWGATVGKILKGGTNAAKIFGYVTGGLTVVLGILDMVQGAKSISAKASNEGTRLRELSTNLQDNFKELYSVLEGLQFESKAESL